MKRFIILLILFTACMFLACQEYQAVNTDLNFAWDAAPLADEYEVYQRDMSNGEVIVLGRTILLSFTYQQSTPGDYEVGAAAIYLDLISPIHWSTDDTAYPEPWFYRIIDGIQPPQRIRVGE